MCKDLNTMLGSINNQQMKNPHIYAKMHLLLEK